MRNGLLFCLLIILSISLVALPGCSSDTDSTTTSSITSNVKTITSASGSTTSSTSETSSNWWDDLGEPQYGGTLIQRTTQLDDASFDPTDVLGSAIQVWVERLNVADWTTTPDNVSILFHDIEYTEGQLAESWELTDPLTLTVYLRQGIKWQDKEPTNGREFTSADVVYTYDKILGTGSGFTEPNAIMASWLSNTERVVALDDYTVQFIFKEASALNIYDLCADIGIGAPENEGITNWEDATGTGPWIVSDFERGVSLTLSKNPNYWGYDERYPENQLPYLDTFKWINITDKSTFLAALRTQQVDFCGDMNNDMTIADQQSMAKSNPEIIMWQMLGQGPSVTLRNDMEPFNDIRVRQALEMSIDRELIAESYYNGTIDGTPCGVLGSLNTWSISYDEWTDELKEEYSYNPTKSIELLTEAGYPDGFSTNIIANSTQDLQLLQVLKAFFSEIGVEMEIESMDMPSMMSLIFSGKTDQMIYHQFSGRGGNTPWQDLGSFTASSSLNWGHVSDEQYEALFASITGADTLDEAKQYSHEAELYELQQHWIISLFEVPHYIPMQPYIKGYSGEYGIGGASHYFARWWIDQSLKDELSN